MPCSKKYAYEDQDPHYPDPEADPLYSSNSVHREEVDSTSSQDNDYSEIEQIGGRHEGIDRRDERGIVGDGSPVYHDALNGGRRNPPAKHSSKLLHDHR